MRRMLAWCLCLLSVGILASSFNQKKIKVACVGDSITEGWGLGDSTYPKHLQRILGDGYEVKNYGKGGRTLLNHGDYPYMNEPMFKEVKEWQPDIVVIKLGTNDSKPQNWKFKDEFAADYKSMIDQFKALPSKPKIYICYPMPVFKDNFGIRESVVKGEQLPMIKKIAKQNHVKLIDLYKPMLPYGNLVPDGVHPNKEGAYYLAAAVGKAIK
ncbi:GDSL-type esterase/lipase family protein [Chitinophaga caeni]|nr:GDSL-type esterase/lipase family protein [Chitinophaga caeni]